MTVPQSPDMGGRFEEAALMGTGKRVAVGIHSNPPHPPFSVGAWLPLALLPSLAIAFGSRLPPWAFMWALAFALYFGCKWLTWRRAGGAPGMRQIGYLLAWVGMDARTFLDAGITAARPVMREYASPLLKTAVGCGLLWLVTPRLSDAPLWLLGWCGMVGLILILHFGLFHLLALLWQRAGVVAEPIMQQPARATSLAEFWGRRWNRGFHQLASEFVFRRCARRYGTRSAMLATFLVSGLVHDLVISLPAGGGYGGPTAYFLLQGLGVVVERSRVGRRCGLGGEWRGWLLTLVFTVGPVCLVFHGPFVAVVVIPFLRAMGAA